MKEVFFSLLLLLTGCSRAAYDLPDSTYNDMVDELKFLHPEAWNSIPNQIQNHYTNVTDYRYLCLMATLPTTLIYPVSTP